MCVPSGGKRSEALILNDTKCTEHQKNLLDLIMIILLSYLYIWMFVDGRHQYILLQSYHIFTF